MGFQWYMGVVGRIPPARMSEWSKEPDLRPGSVSFAGSNPASCINVHRCIDLC